MSKQKEQSKNSKRPGQFKKGDPRINREGRPKGSLDFKTKFYQFLDKLADERDVDPEELEAKVYESYLKKVLGGDTRLLKDILDRLHGKPLKRTDVTTQGEKVGQRELSDEEKELLKKTLKYARRGVDKSGQEDTK